MAGSAGLPRRPDWIWFAIAGPDHPAGLAFLEPIFELSRWARHSSERHVSGTPRNSLICSQLLPSGRYADCNRQFTQSRMILMNRRRHEGEGRGGGSWSGSDPAQTGEDTAPLDLSCDADRPG